MPVGRGHWLCLNNKKVHSFFLLTTSLLSGSRRSKIKKPGLSVARYSHHSSPHLNPSPSTSRQSKSMLHCWNLFAWILLSPLTTFALAFQLVFISKPMILSDYSYHSTSPHHNSAPAEDPQNMLHCNQHFAWLLLLSTFALLTFEIAFLTTSSTTIIGDGGLPSAYYQ